MEGDELGSGMMVEPSFSEPFFFFFFKSTTCIMVYFKQSAWYSKLHLFIPNGHEEHSNFARITFRARVDGSVNHRYVSMHGC